VLNKQWLRECLRKDICSHFASSAVTEGNGLFLDMFSYKVILNVDVLGPCLELGIAGQGQSSLIVNVNIPSLLQMSSCSQVFKYCQ